MTATPDALAPAPAAGRVSRYGAFLSLRVDTVDGVSNGVKRALQVATSLGGFSTSVHASSEGKDGERRPDAEDPARARPGGDHSSVRARHDHR